MFQSPVPKEYQPHLHLQEFDGYIDRGKQMSILHSLLSECVSKVAPGRLAELDRLNRILDRVGIALSQPAGIIRHEPVHNTPSSYQSLQRNIFRFVVTLIKIYGSHLFLQIIVNYFCALLVVGLMIRLLMELLMEEVRRLTIPIRMEMLITATITSL